jgi:hypothetical protein
MLDAEMIERHSLKVTKQAYKNIVLIEIEYVNALERQF